MNDMNVAGAKITKFREPVALRDPKGKTHPSAVGKTKIKPAESNGVRTNRISRE